MRDIATTKFVTKFVPYLIGAWTLNEAKCAISAKC